MMTQVEKDKDPLGVSFSPRRSMPEIKSTNNVISQLKRNSYQEESRISVSPYFDLLSERAERTRTQLFVYVLEHLKMAGNLNFFTLL